MGEVGQNKQKFNRVGPFQLEWLKICPICHFGSGSYQVDALMGWVEFC